MSKNKKRTSGRRSDHTREEIQELALVAAEQIVEEEGLSGLSARKIANAIGYNVAMIYHIFNNLDDLILHANARTLAKLYIALQQSSSKCRAPRTCLIAVSHAYIDFAEQHRNLWNMIYEHVLEDDTSKPAWYQSKVDRVFILIEELIQPLSENLNQRQIEQAAQTLWCGVHGICILTMTKKLDLSVKDMKSMSESLINNYLTGLLNNN